MKLLGGVVLLLFGGLWAIFWCAQLSDLWDTDYRVVFVLVASLALFPVFWATSLLDRALHAPFEPASPPRGLIALPLSNPPMEAKTENDAQLVGLTPNEHDLPKPLLRELPDAGVADIVAGTNSTVASCESTA